MSSQARSTRTWKSADGRRVLVVSEDAEFIVQAAAIAREGGVRLIGCLGPSQPTCSLRTGDRCPLVEHSTITLVDSPDSGVFGKGWESIGAGAYAEELRRTHEESYVILCGAPIGSAGPTGDVAEIEDRASALKLLRSLVRNKQNIDTERIGP